MPEIITEQEFLDQYPTYRSVIKDPEVRIRLNEKGANLEPLVMDREAFFVSRPEYAPFAGNTDFEARLAQKGIVLQGRRNGGPSLLKQLFTAVGFAPHEAPSGLAEIAKVRKSPPETQRIFAPSLGEEVETKLPPSPFLTKIENIKQQFATGAISEATLGIPEAVLREGFGIEPPKPAGTAEQIAKGAGQTVGFIAGAPSRIGVAVARKLIGPVHLKLIHLLGRTPGQGTLIQQATTLGVGFAAAEAGEALSQETLSAALGKELSAAKTGALVGGAFGVARFIDVATKPTASLLARLGVGMALVDAATGQRPWDDREIEQKAFDYLLDVAFLWKGYRPARYRQQVDDIASATGESPTEVLKRIIDQSRRDGVRPQETLQETIDRVSGVKRTAEESRRAAREAEAKEAFESPEFAEQFRVQMKKTEAELFEKATEKMRGRKFEDVKAAFANFQDPFYKPPPWMSSNDAAELMALREKILSGKEADRFGKLQKLQERLNEVIRAKMEGRRPAKPPPGGLRPDLKLTPREEALRQRFGVVIEEGPAPPTPRLLTGPEPPTTEAPPKRIQIIRPGRTPDRPFMPASYKNYEAFTNSESLASTVLRLGGIRQHAPGAPGAIREEVMGVPRWILRKTGLPPDELVSAVQRQGFPHIDSEDSLLQTLQSEARGIEQFEQEWMRGEVQEPKPPEVMGIPIIEGKLPLEKRIALLRRTGQEEAALKLEAELKLTPTEAKKAKAKPTQRELFRPEVPGVKIPTKGLPPEAQKEGGLFQPGGPYADAKAEAEAMRMQTDFFKAKSADPTEAQNAPAIEDAVDRNSTQYGEKLLKASVEAEFRRTGSLKTPGLPIKTSDDVAFLLKNLHDAGQENSYALYLDAEGKSIVAEHLSMGGLGTTIIDTPRIVGSAQLHGAKSVWLIHNHPSGNPSPSRADRAATVALDGALEIAGIDFPGHVVIEGETQYGFVDGGGDIFVRPMPYGLISGTGSAEIPVVTRYQKRVSGMGKQIRNKEDAIQAFAGITDGAKVMFLSMNHTITALYALPLKLTSPQAIRVIQALYVKHQGVAVILGDMGLSVEDNINLKASLEIGSKIPILDIINMTPDGRYDSQYLADQIAEYGDRSPYDGPSSATLRDSGPIYDSVANDADFNQSGRGGSDNLNKEIDRLKRYLALPGRNDLGAADAAIASPFFIGHKHPEFKPLFLRTLGMFEERSETMDALAERIKPYADLPMDQHAKLNEALIEGSLAKRVFTDAELRNRGLSDAQIQGYRAVRSAMDAALDQYKRTLIHLAKGKAKVEKIIEEIDRAKQEGYVPFSRFGKWAFGIKDKTTGEMIYFGKAESWRSADIQWAELSTDFAKELADTARYEAVPPYRQSRAFYRSPLGDMDYFALTIMAKMAKIDPVVAEPFLADMQKFLKTRGFQRHFIRRKDIPGFSRDLGRGLADYLIGVSGYTARIKYRADARELMTDPALLSKPALASYSDEYIKYVTSPREEFTRFRTGMFIWYITGNVKTAALNATQPATTTVPWLWQYAPIKDVAREMERAYREVLATAQFDKRRIIGFDFTKLPADVRDAVAKEAERGSVAQQIIHELMGYSRSQSGFLGGNAWQKLDYTMQETIRLTGFLFGSAEQLNRAVSYVAAYRIGQRMLTQGEHIRGRKEIRLLSADPALESRLPVRVPERFTKAHAFAKDVVENTQFIYCVDRETECLTEQGWKKYYELKQGETLYGLNDQGHIIPVQLQDLHLFYGSIDAYQFSNKNGFSMVVTPEHTCLVQNYNSKNRKWQNIIAKKASDLKGHNHILRSSGPLTSFKSPIYSDDFVKLLAWVAAEGTYAKFRNCKANRNVRLVQSISHNPHHVSEIDNILKRLGYSKRFGPYRCTPSQIVWTLKRPLSDQVREALPDKKIRASLVNKLTVSQMRLFLETFVKGDGHRDKRGWGGPIISQKDKDNTDTLQMMATLCGVSSTSRWSRSAQIHNLYLAKGTKRTMVKECQIGKIKIPFAWCPETSSGNWIARRNGRIFITGNSRANRPRMARGLGAPVFTFRTFTLFYIEMLRKLSGQDKRALFMALGVLFGLAGAMGLPGTRDVRDAMEAAIYQTTGKVVDLEYEARRFIHNLIGAMPADVILHGLGRLTPIDIGGSVGQGQIAPVLDVTQLLGVPVDLLYRRPKKAARYLLEKKYGRAIETVAPEAIRGPLVAFRLMTEGLRGPSGMQLLERTDLRGVEIIGKFLSFQPTRLNRAYEKESARQALMSAVKEVQGIYTERLAKAFLAGQDDQIMGILKEIAAHNARYENRPSQWITITSTALRMKIEAMQMTPGMAMLRYLPRKARPEAIELEQVFPK